MVTPIRALNPNTEAHLQKETKRTKKQKIELPLAEPFWTPPIQVECFYPSLRLLPSVNMICTRIPQSS